jgi:hypothetical protein
VSITSTPSQVSTSDRSPMYGWLEEVEGLSSRWEKLILEYETDLLLPSRIIKWLEAAYAAGYNDAKNETINHTRLPS